MPRVVVAAVKEGNIEEALQEVFRPFGGAEGVLGGRREAFIKVNAVDFKPYCHTDPRAVRALAAILYRAGARRVYVMDNCTQGNFTRLVFRVSGLERAAREAGAVPLYLDEGRQVEVTLPTLGYRVHVSRWVKERLMEGGDENLYISLPKLKTHSMATVTLGVKNQFGLIMQSDRIRDHNWNLHRKFADIFMLVRPHFTVIEGLHALNHGHYAPEGLAGDCVEELGVFIGGEDTLAVDAVGADLLGIDPRQVEHLRLAAEEGLGCIDLEAIEVIGDRGPFRRRYTPELLPVFPPDVRILEGAERCCPEGCSLNTRMVLQMLYVDFHGRGGFTICMGKGWEEEELEALEGPVLVVGDCAAEEAYPVLRDRLGRGKVRVSPGCNDLRGVLANLTPLMGINPINMVPLPVWESTWLLARAMLHRTTARIPPLWAR
ncbi:DUF362 domain-containing protein [Candidatus Solincola tengchongensis]|uniref:DUF362 domain-containing protein n=1 Tax=Candidatus Solincola tengchongensis TaxID=2900693 RepID=UPI00257E154F|nr:DUF362 domain-containing protein [Candidatus Solincola tengchongensis]